MLLTEYNQEFHIASEKEISFQEGLEHERKNTEIERQRAKQAEQQAEQAKHQAEQAKHQAEQLLQELEAYKTKGLTLGSVESMTGGLFAAKFTAIPGSSKVFKGSVVTYATEEKINVVGVKKETVDKYSVVSEEVAKEMAEKGRELLNVDVCVSVTGNAGPTCEPGGKPVGCFYIGVATKHGVEVKAFLQGKKRNSIRNKAVLAMRDLAYLKTI